MESLESAFLSKRQQLKTGKEIPLSEVMKDARFTRPGGAIDRELKSYKINNVYKRVKDDKSAPVLSMRMVHTEKDKESGIDPIGWGNVAKSRLCVRGCFDKMKHQLITDSPCISRVGTRLLTFVCTQFDYVLEKWDVKTAFLNAKLNRTVRVKPPPEAQEEEGIVWELQRAAYGLGDAPRLWYKELRDTLISLGMKMSKYDPCIWMYFSKDKSGKRVLEGRCSWITCRRYAFRWDKEIPRKYIGEIGY